MSKGKATNSVEIKDEGPPSLLSGAEFLQVLFDKLVPLEDAGIDKDLFLYWRKKGLLPFFAKGSWARFSFAQLVWVEMLLDLRSYGYSLEKMQALSDYLFKRAYEADLPAHNFKHTLALLQKKEIAGTISESEKGLRDYINSILEDEALLHAFKYNINYLTNLIVTCLGTGEEAGLLLFKDGTIAEFSEGKYSSGVASELDPVMPHIYLSIRFYLRQFVDRAHLQGVLSPLQLFSLEEQKILREVRSTGVREVRIDVKEGKIQRIESTRDGVLTGEEAEAVRKALGLHNYERITVDTIDEKSLSFKKTRKKL